MPILGWVHKFCCVADLSIVKFLGLQSDAAVPDIDQSSMIQCAQSPVKYKSIIGNQIVLH